MRHSRPFLHLLLSGFQSEIVWPVIREPKYLLFSSVFVCCSLGCHQLGLIMVMMIRVVVAFVLLNEHSFCDACVECLF